MHLNSKLIFQRHALPHLRPESVVLEIGPDKIPSTYQALCAGGVRRWDTTDLYPREGLNFQFLSEYKMPSPDDRYDVVLSGQVLEHVRKPWIWIRELVRVCKPGGHIVTIAPVSWPYHEAPIDCWRVYPEGMRALLEDLPVKISTNEFVCLEENSTSAFLIPGRSKSDQGRKQRLLARWLNPFGVPREAAFDLVCIAQKT